MSCASPQQGLGYLFSSPVAFLEGLNGVASVRPMLPCVAGCCRSFYTSTVYEKGAEVVRMYEAVLGKQGFRKGMDLYFKVGPRL